MENIYVLTFLLILILSAILAYIINRNCCEHEHGHGHGHGHGHDGTHSNQPQQHVPNQMFDSVGMTENLEGEWREVRRYAARVVSTLQQHKYITSHSRVLDLGAGTGIYTQLFVDLITQDAATPTLKSSTTTKTGVVYAADPSQQMRDTLQKRFKQNDHVHITSATQNAIPIPDNSVDLVFLCDVYHHLEDPTALLRDLYRVIRVDGVFVCVDSAPEHMPIMKHEITTQYPDVYKQLQDGLKHGHGHAHGAHGGQDEAALMYRPSIQQVTSQVCHAGFQKPHDLSSTVPFTHHYILVFKKK